MIISLTQKFFRKSQSAACNGPKRNLVFLFWNISTSFDCLLGVIDPTDDDGGIHFSKKSTLWSVWSLKNEKKTPQLETLLAR